MPMHLISSRVAPKGNPGNEAWEGISRTPPPPVSRSRYRPQSAAHKRQDGSDVSRVVLPGKNLNLSSLSSKAAKPFQQLHHNVGSTNGKSR
jgi:hypothetical protein